MTHHFFTFKYVKIAGANIIAWYNLNFQANVEIPGEAFRVWASFSIAAAVGILTVVKIIKDLKKK